MKIAEGFAPGRLWSLWDMIDVKGFRLFAAGEFIWALRNQAGQRLGRGDGSTGLAASVKKLSWFATAASFGGSPTAERQSNTLFSVDELIWILNFFSKDFGSLGLKLSNLQLKRLIKTIEKTGRIPGEDDLSELSSPIKDEMESVTLLHLKEENREYYDLAGNLFGEPVAQTFPSAIYDIAEAGKCYALGRSTACVFHLMRVVELGIHAMGNALGVNLSETGSWVKFLGHLEPAINALPESTEAERERKKGFQQDRAHLHAIRLAWRNDTMHPKATYTDEEAGDVMKHVEIFVKDLAGRV